MSKTIETERAGMKLLTLRELEAATSLWLAWLLTFNSTCITCDEAFSTECLLVFFINFHKCTGDSEAESLTLACVAATSEVCLDVILFSNTKEIEWLLHHELYEF